jgi:LmbE family N-acetylglucosaminyl deacetylase
MISLKLNKLEEPLTILAMGAHCDDIEIGCGGTILSIIKDNPHVNITWIVFSSTEKRKVEATKGAKLYCENAAAFDLKVLEFQDGFLPYHGEDLKNTFESLKGEINPDLIFTHYRHDLHQDHRLVSELTWNTFRNHLILEYEIPKWDGDIGTPNTFVHLDEATGLKKIKYLQKIYNSQKTKVWFTDDLLWSLMRIRGMESNSPSLIAEAFYSRKSVLNV